MPSPEPATPIEKPRLSFDTEICARLSEACQDIFLKHPEVQSLSVSIAWFGGLNDADINHAVWIGPNGAVTTPSGVLTSVFQTLKLLDKQMGRAMDLVEGMRTQTEALAKEALKKHGELQKLLAEIEAAKTARGSD